MINDYRKKIKVNILMALTAIVNRKCLLSLGIKNKNKSILFSKFTNTTFKYKKHSLYGR